MATKAFKKLPKAAQRAAFAEMDKDGSRRGGGRAGGLVKSNRKYVSNAATTELGAAIKRVSGKMGATEQITKRAELGVKNTAPTGRTPDVKKHRDISRQFNFLKKSK